MVIVGLVLWRLSIARWRRVFCLEQRFNAPPPNNLSIKHSAAVRQKANLVFTGSKCGQIDHDLHRTSHRVFARAPERRSGHVRVGNCFIATNAPSSDGPAARQRSQKGFSIGFRSGAIPRDSTDRHHVDWHHRRSVFRRYHRRPLSKLVRNSGSHTGNR